MPNNYPLLAIVGPKSLVALATWILQFGTDQQRNWVKGYVKDLM